MEKQVHDKCDQIIMREKGLFHIISLKQLRHTENVDFEIMSLFEEFNGIDIVTHKPGARSPGKVNGEGNHWYMHPAQEDNMITLSGNRFVELYTAKHGKIEIFEISHERIKLNGKVVHEGPAILGWPVGVYHRNYSPNGSVSMNFAVRGSKFNLDTEFNIYDVNTETGKTHVARIGKLDQPK